MQLHLAYDAQDAATARALVEEQLTAWHVSAAPLLDWFDEADAVVPDGAIANVAITYRPADRVLSLDVWTAVVEDRAVAYDG